MTIHSGGIGQLLIELVDVERYAEAVVEYTLAERDPNRPRSGVITLANERAIWR